MTREKVAVLGAGVMGAQIAAHFFNAGMSVILYDLPATEGAPNALVQKAIKGLKKLKPSPVGKPGWEQAIQAANYEHDLPQLSECTLVVEAISERLDWKQALFQKVAPFLGPETLLATNSSGLSIEKIAQSLPESVRERFCGVHFFNPPRYMKLVELIPHSGTTPEVLDRLETFLVERVGKGVVRAKDTPNFIANRIGLFAFLSSVAHARDLGLSVEAVDALSGPLVGRPKSATFRTMDVVGLDVMQHVVSTMAKGLESDPWHAHFQLPAWIDQLVANGALGQKTRAGIYKKQGKNIEVFDPTTAQYRALTSAVDPAFLEKLKSMPPTARLQFCRQDNSPEAQFIWRCARDLFHYSAHHLTQIADSVRDVDLAIRWGFAWQQGPFEMWQMAGWAAVAGWIEEDRAAGKTLSDAPLPTWVGQVSAVYRESAAYAPAQRMQVPHSTLPVYQQHLTPLRLAGQQTQYGQTLAETPATRLWTLDDEVVIINFKTPRNCISQEVLEGIQHAVSYAEQNAKGLVLYPQGASDFSVGADLKQALKVLKVQGYDVFEKAVETFQTTALALQNSAVPVVAALKGLVLGGGCELAMHCSSRVASFETYIGLVETGVGLIPAGGGCKELARRISNASSMVESIKMLERYFKQVAMAEVSSSAYDAVNKGYLQSSDAIVMQEESLLFAASARVNAMHAQGYCPESVAPIRVLGAEGKAVLQAMLVNMRKGHLITEHDYQVASALAHVLSGGDLDLGVQVDEAWLLRLEREAFVALGKMEKTVDRIAHTMQHGKPLRN